MSKSQFDSHREAVLARAYRKAKTAQLIACVMAAIVFGVVGFFIGRANQLSAITLALLASISGSALAFAVSQRNGRIIREEVLEIRRVTSLIGFKQRYNRVSLRSLIAFGSIFVLITVGVPLVMNHYPRTSISQFIERYFWAFWITAMGSIVASFFTSLHQLHRVVCPNCTEKLIVRSSRPDLESTYSGLCKRCGTLWDLEVGSSD